MSSVIYLPSQKSDEIELVFSRPSSCAVPAMDITAAVNGKKLPGKLMRILESQGKLCYVPLNPLAGGAGMATQPWVADYFHLDRIFLSKDEAFQGVERATKNKLLTVLSAHELNLLRTYRALHGNGPDEPIIQI